MSFTIGPSSSGMGPRSAMEQFGQEGGKSTSGEAFNPRVISRMLTYLRPYRRWMAIAFVLMIFESLLTLAIPYLYKIAFDENIAQADLSGLAVTVGLIAAAFVLSFFVSSGQRYILSWVGQRVLANLRGQLFRHLQRLPSATTTTTSLG